MASKIVTKVFKSALELFFEFGFHGTSMKMIIDHAGVSNGGVFHHFKTKEDLIVALYSHVKMKYYEDLMDGLDLQMKTKDFIYNLWYKKLIWNMENPIERYFLNLFSISSYHSDYEDELKQKLGDLITKINHEKEIKIIDVPETKYFMMEMDSSVNTLTRYLNMESLDYHNVDIKKYFYRYWKSILKMS